MAQTLRPIDMQKKVSQYQFEAIVSVFNDVSEWVTKNFSEVSFQVEFNDDSQNPRDPAFRIKTRLITSKAMDKDDQFLKKFELVIRTPMWEDSLLMQKWIAAIYPTFTNSITKQINEWYAHKKEIGTAT